MKVEEIETIIQKVVHKVLVTQETKHFFKVGIIPYSMSVPNKIKKQIINVEWTSPEENECHALLIDSLTFSQISAIANLQQIDYKTDVIINYLLKGKAIFILQVDTFLYQKKQQKKYKLWKKTQELWQHCQDYGVVLLTDPVLLSDYLTQKKRSSSKGKKTKKFITEQDLVHMQENKQYQISDEDQLTPLAYDFAKKHHLLK